jgi:glycosyltransferase involved in cell wall biosynthesis
MKILQVHNFYQSPGGEDRACASEYDLLTMQGHSVIRHFAHNDQIKGMSDFTIGVKAIWNTDAYKEVRTLIQSERPDVIHAHNTFPLVSPAIYYAAAVERVPVIQTLHNYRLICPGGNLFRDGHLCEQCVGSTVPYKAVLHKCYRNNRLASVSVASMLLTHRAAHTWKTKVSAYIALTEFARDKFVEGGLPKEKLVLKPNFLSRDPGIGLGDGEYAFFIGRLCEEKGVRTLLAAWERLGGPLRLKIAGDGPLAEWGRQRTGASSDIEWIGQAEHDQVMQLLKGATFLICPSLYHEGGPLTILEAFGCGTPVIASDLDSINEFVVDGVNGFRFQAGNANDLAYKVQTILAKPSQLRVMRDGARLSYEQNYTPERNYELLMRIYRDAVGNRNGSSTV